VSNDAMVIILGRGGSRGVPRKNVARIAGRPCVAWTVDAAKASRTAGLVVVSSDDEEILLAGRDAGAVPIARPDELATDTARVDDAARHTLDEIERQGLARVTPRTPVVILYANVPVRPNGLIDRAVSLMIESGADSVQSYAPVGKHHPWWTARLGDAGVVAPWEGPVLNHGVFRRQDLPPAYIPDGGVLVVSAACLRLNVPGVPAGPHAFFGNNRRGVINDEGSVIDIDGPIDMLVADAILSARHGREAAA